MRMRYILLLVLVLIVTWSLKPLLTARSAVSRAGSSPDPMSAASDGDRATRSRGLWWSAVGVAGGMAIHVSDPVLLVGERMPRRLITIVSCLPGTEDMLGCGAFRPLESTAEPVGIHGGLVHVTIVPRAGLRWGDVWEKADVVVEGSELFR